LCLSHDSIVNEHFFSGPSFQRRPEILFTLFPIRDGETITLGPQRKPFLQNFFALFQSPPRRLRQPPLTLPAKKNERQFLAPLRDSNRTANLSAPPRHVKPSTRGFYPQIFRESLPGPLPKNSSPPPCLIASNPKLPAPRPLNPSHQQTREISISPRPSIGFSLFFDGQPTGLEKPEPDPARERKKQASQPPIQAKAGHCCGNTCSLCPAPSAPPHPMNVARPGAELSMSAARDSEPPNGWGQRSGQELVERSGRGQPMNIPLPKGPAILLLLPPAIVHTPWLWNEYNPALPPNEQPPRARERLPKEQADRENTRD
jgi:hypothetical protein